MDQLRLGMAMGVHHVVVAVIVGIGFSQHSGMVIVCDGTDEAAERIARVLHNDPATGVMRHADAGYEIAVECAKEKGLDLPGILG